MEKDEHHETSLKKIISECIKSVCELEENSLKKGKYYFIRDVNELVGRLMLESTPSYTFVLAVEDVKMKCVIKDPADNLEIFIKVHGKMVAIEGGYIVVERFKYGTTNVEDLISLVINGSNIKLIDDENICSNHEVAPIWKQRFLVQHVSTPFFINERKPVCYVLVSVILEGKGNKKKDMWFLLTGDQLSWKELLVPNREYLLALPLSNDKDYFFSNSKSVQGILKIQASECTDHPIKDIMHHPEWFPSVECVALPESACIYLQSNSCLSSLPSESVLWQSFGQVETSNEKIFTIYGQIKSVDFEIPFQTKGCSLCMATNDGVKKKVEASVKSKQWVDPWIQTLTLPEDKTEFSLPLPKVINVSSHSSFQYFSSDNITQKIILEDSDSGEECTLYMRNWCNYLRPRALCPGLMLLAKFVVQCYSKKGNLYYTTCALSSFQILQDNRKSNKKEPWGPYRFPHVEVDMWTKVWGILNMEKLIKVSIRAICSICSSEFEFGKCSLATCLSTGVHTVTAIAIVFVFNKNGETASVFLKDDQVRIYLGIDESQWAKYCQFVGGMFKLTYTNTSEGINCNEHLLQKFFSIYCKVLRPRRKFYISVRRIRPARPETDSTYYCCSIIPFKDDNIVSPLSEELTSELQSLAMKL